MWELFRGSVAIKKPEDIDVRFEGNHFFVVLPKGSFYDFDLMKNYRQEIILHHFVYI